LVLALAAGLANVPNVRWVYQVVTLFQIKEKVSIEAIL
jgi:hypothetical protein